jgi:hypothetical protein
MLILQKYGKTILERKGRGEKDTTYNATKNKHLLKI